MSPVQERIAVLIAFCALIFVVVLLLIIWIPMMSGRLAGNTFPGSTYLLVMAGARDIGLMFGAIFTVITVGANLLGRASVKPWVTWTSSILCLIGLALCLWLFLQMKVHQVAQPIWSRAEALMSYRQLQEGNLLLIGVVAGWLGSFMLTQLGIAVWGRRTSGTTSAPSTPGPTAPQDSQPSIQTGDDRT